MEWYNYLATFFAGAILANAVPHFVHGISGNRFPSPFSKPSGIGLSSAPVNVIWGLFNIAMGYALMQTGENNVYVFFAGAAVMSIMLSIHFQKKYKD